MVDCREMSPSYAEQPENGKAPESLVMGETYTKIKAIKENC